MHLEEALGLAAERTAHRSRFPFVDMPAVPADPHSLFGTLGKGTLFQMPDQAPVPGTSCSASTLAVSSKAAARRV